MGSFLTKLWNGIVKVHNHSKELMKRVWTFVKSMVLDVLRLVKLKVLQMLYSPNQKSNCRESKKQSTDVESKVKILGRIEEEVKDLRMESNKTNDEESLSESEETQKPKESPEDPEPGENNDETVNQDWEMSTVNTLPYDDEADDQSSLSDVDETEVGYEELETNEVDFERVKSLENFIEVEAKKFSDNVIAYIQSEGWEIAAETLERYHSGVNSFDSLYSGNCF